MPFFGPDSNQTAPLLGLRLGSNHANLLILFPYISIKAPLFGETQPDFRFFSYHMASLAWSDPKEEP